MFRRSLLTFASLGALTSVVGVTGILAVGTDTATTGVNRVETGTYGSPPETDFVLLYQPIDTDQPCPTDQTLYSLDLTTGSFDIGPDTARYNVFGPDYHEQGARNSLCIMNTGSSAVALDVQIPDTVANPYVDVEVDCAVDNGEDLVDPTCGTGQAGELANFIGLEVWAFDPTCSSAIGPRQYLPPASFRSTYQSLATVGSGAVTCIRLAVADGSPFYDPTGTAQTDSFQWSYEFRATQQ